MTDQPVNVAYLSDVDRMVQPVASPAREDIARYWQLVNEVIAADYHGVELTREEICQVLSAAGKSVQQYTKDVRDEARRGRRDAF